jgi:DNA-binding PadR family transcriptional regulator
MSRGSRLTTTSYALLGLLAIQPWSTYELAQQMDRGLGRIWPRAASKLYEEPKKLVALGLARASSDAVGRRARTVYAITPAGRAALRTWLSEPGAGPVVEFEQLVKIFFADHGTTAETLAILAAVHEWAVERNAGNLAVARAYQAGRGPFQRRAAQTLLAGRFLTDFYAMVANWASWANGVVERWPSDPADAQVDQAALDETVEKATWSAGHLTEERFSSAT